MSQRWRITGLALLAALTMGLAPFTPEPHFVEKLRWLAEGTPLRALDWFDLLLHGTPWCLLVVALVGPLVWPWLVARFYDPFQARLEAAVLGPWRADLLADLRGEVLELGAGTGANLPHYGAGASRVVLAEPDVHMRRILQGKAPDERFQVVDHAAEALPYPDGSFDAVVFTLVLCTVDDPVAALAEAKRVLRPGGRLVYLEHIRSADPAIRRRQDLLQPLWGPFARGCHLNRDTDRLIREAGFEVSETEEAMRGAPRWVARTVRGVGTAV